MDVYVLVHMYVQVHVEAKVELGVFCYHSPPYLLKQDLLLNSTLTSYHWLARDLQGSTCLHPRHSNTRVPNTYDYIWLLHVYWE